MKLNKYFKMSKHAPNAWKINENVWKCYCHRSWIRPRPRPTPAQASHLKISPKWLASSSSLKIDGFTFAFARFWLVRVGGYRIGSLGPAQAQAWASPGQGKARPGQGQARQARSRHRHRCRRLPLKCTSTQLAPRSPR